MAAQAENPRLLRALADFEKELVKASNLLKQNSEAIKQSLAAVPERAAALDEIVSLDANAAKSVQRSIEEKKLLLLYTSLSASVSELEKAIRNFEEKTPKLEVFLESLRRERAYSFKTDQNLLNFVEKAFSTFGQSEAFFSPEFVGMIDLNDVSEQLHLQRKDKQHLLVGISKISELFSFLRKKGAARGFRLESDAIKIFVKSPLQLRVEADNEKIKRADHLAIEMEATVE